MNMLALVSIEMTSNGAARSAGSNNGEDVGIKKVSNFRNVASQSIALFANCLLRFTSGNFLGLTKILLPIIHGPNADEEIEMSKHEYTWFTSYLWMEPLGALIAGPLAHLLGSRTILLIASISSTCCWMAFHLARNSTTMLTAQAIVGLTKAVILGPCVTYIAEMSQPHLRSTFIAINGLCIILGSFFTVLVSKWLPWRTVVLINLAFAVVGFLAIFSIPDSPHWLAAKGKLTEAELSLAWLRGWTTPESVRSEFNLLSKSNRKSPPIAEKRSWKAKFRPYFERSFLVPLAMIFSLFVIDAATGSQTIQIYCLKIFEKIQSPMNEHTASIVFESMRIAGAVFCILTVHLIGKKNLCLFSLGSGCFCYLTVATVTYLVLHKQVAGEIYFWIPTIMIIVSTFAMTTGINKVISMLNGELFPAKYRNVGTGFGTFFTFMAGAVMTKAFEYMIDWMTLQGVFLFFAVACVVGFVGIYMIIPETEGRTLMEIEDHFAGIRNLSDRSSERSRIDRNLIS